MQRKQQFENSVQTAPSGFKHWRPDQSYTCVQHNIQCIGPTVVAIEFYESYATIYFIRLPCVWPTLVFTGSSSSVHAGGTQRHVDRTQYRESRVDRFFEFTCTMGCGSTKPVPPVGSRMATPEDTSRYPPHPSKHYPVHQYENVPNLKVDMVNMWYVNVSSNATTSPREADVSRKRSQPATAPERTLMGCFAPPF